MISSIWQPSRLARPGRRRLIYFICGNPGCIGFYGDFLEALHGRAVGPRGPGGRGHGLRGGAGEPGRRAALRRGGAGRPLHRRLHGRRAHGPPPGPPPGARAAAPEPAPRPAAVPDARLPRPVARRPPRAAAAPPAGARRLRRLLVAVAAEWAVSRHGLRRAWHLCLSELDEVREDRWPDDVWAPASSPPLSAPRFFLYGRNDHWVADHVRDDFVRRRREHQAWGGRTTIVDDGDILHAFCVTEHNSWRVARTVHGWIQEIEDGAGE